MLQVTARVFDNNQLVGYQITDGQQTQLFTKQQAWIYAKNKQLLNVVATGDETNPGLSGTNGFELKRLPEIKWKEPQSVKTKFNFNTQDAEAAFLRNVIKSGIIQRPDRDIAMQYLKSDATSGIVSPQNCRALSASLLVENTLCDSKSTKRSIGVGSIEPTENNKKLINELKPIYTAMRFIADAIKEVMQINNTDSIPYKTVLDLIAEGELESLKNYVLSGHTMDEVEVAFNKLKEFIQIEIKPDDDLSGTVTKDMLSDLDTALNAVKAGANMTSTGLVSTPAVIGYKIKNLSSQPISIIRMTATPDHSTSQAVLNPNQSICLNRTEMAFLSSKPEIGCTFANGKVVNSSKKTAQSLYQLLESYYFTFTRMESSDSDRYDLMKGNSSINGISVNDNRIKLDVRKLESPDIITTYFIPQNQEQTVQQKITQAQQTKQKIQQQGLFNGFKH